MNNKKSKYTATPISTLKKKKKKDVEHPGGTFSSQGSTVLGNPVPRDRSKPRPSNRILRK
jgi:hypothetical protein